MYGKNPKFRGKKRYYKKKPMSPTRKAFLAGVKAGKRMARSQRWK